MPEKPLYLNIKLSRYTDGRLYHVVVPMSSLEASPGFS